MTVIVDTGPLVAFTNASDPEHDRAVGLFERVRKGQYGVPFSTDYVLDEGLTLLRRRPGRLEVSRAFSERFFSSDPTVPPLVEFRQTNPDQLRAALRLHLERYERKLSFTDCTLVAIAREAGAVMATFDRGFQGLVPIVDG